MEKKRFKIAIAQLNPISGDVAGNYKKIMANIEKAKEKHAEMILFSPLALSGINIKEQVFNSDFMRVTQSCLKQIASEAKIQVFISVPNGGEVIEYILQNGEIHPVSELPFNINTSIVPFGKEKPLIDVGIHLKALGGFDEMVYTGGTTIINPDNRRVHQMKFFEEDFVVLEFENRIDGCYCIVTNDFQIYENEEFLWNALCLGLRDYVNKAGFKKVLLGMSGGMDSAFVCALAVDALGSENVMGIALPSRYSSDESERLARKQCERLNVRFEKIAIEDTFITLEKTLHPLFKDYKSDVTEENMQARIRGVILMSLSNKFNSMLLATGNKSEGSVGYATLYGDTCGGFNPIKDVYKTDIYRLAKWRNTHKPEMAMGDIGEVIVEDIINRPPTAELRENQKDSDSLPEYPVLDTILFELIENGKAPSQLYNEFEQDVVDKVYRLLLIGQYKRSQSVVGTSVTIKPLAELWLPSAFKYNI